MMNISFDDVAQGIFMGIIIVFGIVMVLLPSIIAVWRRHPRKWAIILLNFSTPVGWVIAGSWALADFPEIEIERPKNLRD
jgi:zinc transporter ZupT